MVRTCMFCGTEELGEDLTYHGFPLKAAEWLHNMGLGSNFVPSTKALVCSNHFEKNCFQKALPKAVFSLEAFLPFSDSTNLIVSSVMLKKDRIKTDHFANFH